ncbi:MAG: MoaD/ThiS family protein [Acidimicrobiales bacterium]
MSRTVVRIVLPSPLRVLAAIRGSEVTIEVTGDVTQRRVLDALEASWPALAGTVRDPVTGRRRPFVRFFACGEDLSHDPPDTVLPEAVSKGAEPFVVLGAIAGG